MYVIAEIGINHNGSIELAKNLIHQAFDSKCQAVKFQKRDIESVYTQEELDKYRESPWGTTNRQQKEGLEFSIEEYQELYSYTKELGMDFIVSCWDRKSIKLIEDNLNVDYHKVASALVTDEEFLKDLTSTGKPTILSTGMSTQEQVDKAVQILSNNLEYVLACTSTYPTVPEELNLKYIQTLKEEYPQFKIGFSNHHISNLTKININEIYDLQRKNKLKTVFKRVDTCGNEFDSSTAYLYSTFISETNEFSCESRPSNKKKIIILGSGPNRIGQGIEFDYFVCKL